MWNDSVSMKVIMAFSCINLVLCYVWNSFEAKREKKMKKKKKSFTSQETKRYANRVQNLEVYFGNEVF